MSKYGINERIYGHFGGAYVPEILQKECYRAERKLPENNG